jgi:hypothetical protein
VRAERDRFPEIAQFFATTPFRQCSRLSPSTGGLQKRLEWRASRQFSHRVIGKSSQEKDDENAIFFNCVSGILQQSFVQNEFS